MVVVREFVFQNGSANEILTTLGKSGVGASPPEEFVSKCVIEPHEMGNARVSVSK
jgi:hypothetical protein